MPRSDSEGLSAAEWTLVLAYRRCSERRKSVIMRFAKSLSAQEEHVEPAAVLPFLRHDTK